MGEKGLLGLCQEASHEVLEPNRVRDDASYVQLLQVFFLKLGRHFLSPLLLEAATEAIEHARA